MNGTDQIGTARIKPAASALPCRGEITRRINHGQGAGTVVASQWHEPGWQKLGVNQAAIAAQGGVGAVPD